MNDDSRLVYSTEAGRICPRCSRPARLCTCSKRKDRKAAPAPFPDDGTVRIRRETHGRKGKTVTAIYGLSAAGADPDRLARDLKRRCGTGGSVADEVVLIQGDHRQTLQTELERLGFTVRLAGG